MKHFLHWLPSPQATSRLACGLALLASHSWFGLQAIAQTNTENYPEKPIKIIVPYTPGGGTDTVARLIGERMSRTLGQQIMGLRVVRVADLGPLVDPDPASRLSVGQAATPGDRVEPVPKRSSGMNPSKTGPPLAMRQNGWMSLM